MVCVPLCAALQIRRELAAAMRDVGKLVGNAAMLSYVVNIVATNHQAMKSHIREAGVQVIKCCRCRLLHVLGLLAHLDVTMLTA